VAGEVATALRRCRDSRSARALARAFAPIPRPRPSGSCARWKAGIRYGTREEKRLRFHDLRHSAATILLAAGVPERVVMEILGHSTTAMIKRYQHVLPGLTIAAAERMDQVMGR
jgi:integrase